MSATPYYEDERCVIYHGDCREIGGWLAGDVLVTDPPYGISYSSGWARDLVWSNVYGDRGDGSIDGDADTALRDTVLAAWGVERPGLVFGSLRAPMPPGWRAALCWDKGEAAGMGDLRIPWKPNWEPIFVIGQWPGTHGRASGVVRANNISRVSMGRAHPHAKPVSLLRQLIDRCPPGVVVDPFMGSGGTLRAAKDLGRRAIGVESEERYCEVAAKRLAQEVLDFEGVA